MNKEAKLAQKERDLKQREMWVDIQDVIGPARLWPVMIRRLFWSKHITHWERCLVAAFAHVNSLHPDMFMDWARFMGLGRDESAYRLFSALFKLFKEKKV